MRKEYKKWGMLAEKIIRQVNHYIMAYTLFNTIHFALKHSTLKYGTLHGPTLIKIFQI